ncbi:leucine--tRNA ligase [bacterium]|nr:leucine--tRNA ligase [bacterium]
MDKQRQQYNPQDIETKWQDYWQKNNFFAADNNSDKPKYYILSMFPYPSGILHMGHVMNYTLSDTLVRYHKMLGQEVLSPIGWDSFGLPAENAAIRLGIPPEENTKNNIRKMRIQMKRAGWGYDWNREIATSHPDYYKWTQWLFLKFYKQGLALRKKAPVNWCPNDQTVLANEQVHEGRCERCGTEVIQKDLEQWFFTMSEFAQRLLDNHCELTRWPEKVIKMQQEWIGRSEGARIDFIIKETGEKLPVFTTRPDTVFGVTFMSIAPEHPLIEKLVEGTAQQADVMKAVKKMRSMGTSAKELVGLEKEGVPTGFHVINPVNGDIVPLWVANFALMTYGTGAVMSVPAHDQRDFEFAKKYNLPIKIVIQPQDKQLDLDTMAEAYVENGLQINSGPFDGIANRKAMPKIIKWLDDNGYGKKTINYSLRDWLLSRQRYWGVPIPIIECDQCGEVPVPEEDLPVLLPKNVEFKPTGESPLAQCPDFINTICPKCAKPAKRISDTMDTFVDSSWYMYRYINPREENKIFNPDDVNKWCPVDFYIGGIEHATMHLIYSRFFAQVMKDMGLINFAEPAKRLFCQGMVCKTAHYCDNCKWLEDKNVENGKCRICGSDVVSEVLKMSKTKLNTVSPDEIMNKYGADTMRLYILSDTPPDRERIWNEDGVQGAHRFLRRFWDLIIRTKDIIDTNTRGCGKDNTDLYRKTHYTIKQVTADIEKNIQMNTVLARIFELTNAIKSAKNVSSNILKEAVETAVKLLSPIAPHITEELWRYLGHNESLLKSSWPIYDEKALTKTEFTVIIQVNGKLRSKMVIPSDTPKEKIEKLALSDEKTAGSIEGKKIIKTIVVPNKLVNFVVK